MDGRNTSPNGSKFDCDWATELRAQRQQPYALVRSVNASSKEDMCPFKWTVGYLTGAGGSSGYTEEITIWCLKITTASSFGFTQY